MKLAKVVAVHASSNKVDLLFMDDNRRVPGVKVMSHDASSSSGRVGLPTPDAQASDDPYLAPAISSRDLIACVAFYDGLPVVQGFLHPEVSEMFFPDPDRMMERTPSDFYHTVDGKGNAEWFHPSGAYIRMGTDPAHEDLTGKDYNQSFNAKRNADQKIHFHIAQAGGKASIDIDPDGNVVITHGGNMTIQTSGTSTIHSDGDMNLSSGSHINLSAPRIDLNQ